MSIYQENLIRDTNPPYGIKKKTQFCKYRNNTYEIITNFPGYFVDKIKNSRGMTEYYINNKVVDFVDIKVLKKKNKMIITIDIIDEDIFEIIKITKKNYDI